MPLACRFSRTRVASSSQTWPDLQAKFCKGCEQEKPVEDFSLAKRGKGGRAYYCRPCAAEKRRDHYARNRTPEVLAANAERMRGYLRSNPEQAAKDRARSLAWYRDNTEVAKARAAEWASRNPDKAKASVARYRAANPEKGLEYRHRRIARLAGAPVNDFTAADWREVLADFNHSCAYCLATGLPLQKEHMQPISRGGDHTRSNIVPACGPCNMRKGTRTLLESLSVLTVRRD